MKKKRLEDDDIYLREVGFIQNLMRSAFKIYEFNAEESEGPAITHLDLVFNSPDTWNIVSQTYASDTPSSQPDEGERPGCRVISINGSGWFLTHIAGERAAIHRIAAAAEALGAERITS